VPRFPHPCFAMASFLQPECVSAESKHWGRCVPMLDLSGDVHLPFRVYVLRCAPRHTGGPPTLYVGVEHRSHIARRVQSHFAQRAAHFTLAHKPMGVAVVWPVASRAAEAYVFYALMESLPLCSVESGRLGGWTQTQSDPSRLQAFMLQREWRMLTRRCLDCGSSQHWSGDSQCVPKALAYPCSSCGSTVRVRSNGEMLAVQPPRQGAAATPPAAATAAADAAAASVLATASRGHKRARGAEAAAPPEQQRRAYSRVQVCGREYTSLAWFLGRGNPFPRDCHRAAATCGRNALELLNGDAKTLLARGFARGRPAQGKELLPGRRNLPGAWVDTACLAVRGGGAVQLRRPGSVRGSRGVLWRVSDLQEAFGG
jgi:predicted GIY-YIG superfamily endonuclease